MIVTTHTKVLYVSPASQMQSLPGVLKELQSFLDPESLEVLQKLYLKGFFRESSRHIRKIELIEFEQDVPFVEIPTLIKERGLISASVSSCLDLLHALHGRKNQDIRESFFNGGFTLLSMESLVLEGKVHYLVIGEDHSSPKRDGQNLFSVRLLTPFRTFAHRLYRVIGAHR